MIVLSEVLTSKGPEDIPSIDSVFLPEPCPEALRALVRFAGGRWPDRAASPAVTAPNLARIDGAVLRAAGLRATPSCFNAHAFAPRPDDPILEAGATNLEIV
jgi:hypothetical protein